MKNVAPKQHEWPEDRAIAEMDERASMALLKLVAFAGACGGAVGVAVFALLMTFRH